MYNVVNRFTSFSDPRQNQPKRRCCQIMSMDIFRPDALAGKSILVTGGGSGLGKEISKALAEKGAVVHICGRRAAVLDSAATEIGAHGGQVHPHICDIRDSEQVDKM